MGSGDLQGTGKRSRLRALLLLVGMGWFGVLFAGASKKPALRTGELPESKSSESVSDAASKSSAVKRAQKPAPEIEDQFRNFKGERSPPASAELSFEPTADGRYKITNVDQKGPFAGKYQVGEVVDEIPTPHLPVNNQ